LPAIATCTATGTATSTAASTRTASIDCAASIASTASTVLVFLLLVGVILVVVVVVGVLVLVVVGGVLVVVPLGTPSLSKVGRSDRKRLVDVPERLLEVIVRVVAAGGNVQGPKAVVEGALVPFELFAAAQGGLVGRPAALGNVHLRFERAVQEPRFQGVLVGLAAAAAAAAPVGVGDGVGSGVGSGVGVGSGAGGGDEGRISSAHVRFRHLYDFLVVLLHPREGRSMMVLTMPHCKYLWI